MLFSFNTFHFVLLVAAVLAGTSAATQPVDLGGACAFAILTKTGITNVPTSTITGYVGASPTPAITGVPLTADAVGLFSTSPQVTGRVYTDSGAGVAADAVLDMGVAYTEGSTRAATYATNPGDGAGGIGGATFFPGVYKFAAAINIATDITLDAQDDPNAVFIITAATTITLAAGMSVNLLNGARADNIFWHAAGTVTLGAGGHMEGNVLSMTNIVFSAAASLNGRALAQTAATLISNTITKPTGCGEPVTDSALLSC
jgi:hypothetical protein